ncbi:LCP family protein [Streptosporangium sp. KLBMP 9127]|nr:LCP family protein [Streptosporangium sp. KLBMP 9127]
MSDHRHPTAQDQRALPAESGRRASRRAMHAPPDQEPDLYEDQRYAPRAEPPAPPDDEPPYDDPPRGRRRKGGGDGGKRMKLLAWGSIALTGILVAVTLTGYGLYRVALSGINTEDLSKKLSKNRPVNDTGALNILIVGSDTREGDNLRYGQKMANAGKRTDTMILMHISPNRDNATLVSFPRDSVVQIPQCTGDNGALYPPKIEMINAAYNQGGIACTINTLEALTKIRIDHHVEVDFTGFKNIVDALGGIRVCLKQPVADKKAKLELAAGWHNLKGEAALGYVRLRNYGDGSDTQRIKRQQVFLSQVVKKATSSDLISNPGKLLDLIQAAGASVTMDTELASSTDTLLRIAQSARALTASGVKFTTVPGGPHPDDKNRVQWRQPDANNLFDSIRRDIEIKPTAAPKPSTSTSTAPKPTIKAGDVKIQVLNGTNVPGRAKEVADALTEQGFKVTQVGNGFLPGGVEQPKTKLLYAKNAADGADYAAPIVGKLINKVSAQAGKIKPVSSEPYIATSATPAPRGAATATKGPVIQLVIGADWEGVKAPVKIPDSVKDSVVDAKTDPCQ